MLWIRNCPKLNKHHRRVRSYRGQNGLAGAGRDLVNKSYFRLSALGQPQKKAHPFAEKKLSVFITIPTAAIYTGTSSGKSSGPGQSTRVTTKIRSMVLEDLESLCRSLTRYLSCTFHPPFLNGVVIQFSPGKNGQKCPFLVYTRRALCKRRVPWSDNRIWGREERLGEVFAFYAFHKIVIKAHVNQ